MKESAVWPYNIVPALRNQAAEAERSAMLGVHPRIVDGLRELAGLEPRSARAHQLVALCDQWPEIGGGALLPAGEVLDIVGAEGE